MEDIIEKKKKDSKKVSFLDHLSIAFLNPSEYKQISKLSVGRVTGFVIFVAFLFVFIEFGISVITLVAGMGGYRKMATEKVPQFVYENGTLSMEDEYKTDIGPYTVYVDTSKEKISYEMIGSDGLFIALGSKNVSLIALQGSEKYEYGTYELSQVFGRRFDNNALADTAPMFYLMVVFMYGLFMVGKVIKLILIALLLSIAGAGFSKSIKTGLSYGQVLAICIYSICLTNLITSVNKAVDGLIPTSIIFMVNLFITIIFLSRGIGCHATRSVPPRGTDL